MDEARASQLARSAALEVAKAQVSRADAALEASRIPARLQQCYSELAGR